MRKLLFCLFGFMMFVSCANIQKGDSEANRAKQDSPVKNSNIHSTSQVHSGINIINTGPRGGSFTSPGGTEIRYTIFRIQVVNDTIIPLDLEFKFPETPVPLLPDSTVRLSISLLPDSLTPETIQDDLNFGVIGIEDFLYSKTSGASILKSTIQTGEQHVFYIGIQFSGELANGTTRSILFVNGRDIDAPFLPVRAIETDEVDGAVIDLVFGIGVDPPNYYSLIPCGQIRY